MFRKSTILAFLFAAAASASTFNVNTTDRGYYYSYDFNDPTNDNYLTGQLAATGFHSFFAFGGLSGLDGPIVSATLNLFNPQAGYSSSNATETLAITQFSGDLATLEAGGTVAGEYDALASGTSFGTQAVGAADDNAFVSIQLNADAIAFLNSSGGAFAFGGNLGTFGDTDDHYIFGGSGNVPANFGDGNSYLTIVTRPTSAVPEPSMAFFMLPVFAVLVVARKLSVS